MKRTSHYWFLFFILLIPKACETSDPASLPRYPASNLPVVNPSTSNTSLQVIPAANVASSAHPLQIDAMRARDYPGSDIVVEQVLEPGGNYSRYYVSYLSDGLKIYALMTVPNRQKAATG